MILQNTECLLQLESLTFIDFMEFLKELGFTLQVSSKKQVFRNSTP